MGPSPTLTPYNHAKNLTGIKWKKGRAEGNDKGKKEEERKEKTKEKERGR